MVKQVPGDPQAAGFWLDDPGHRAFLAEDAAAALRFFAVSPKPAGGFHTLDYEGKPLPNAVQELHTTTRLVHSYAMAKRAGWQGADALIDQGMRYLASHHRDPQFGGWLWALDGDEIHDQRKLTYGHVFVLLAGSSAKAAGHPLADHLIAEATQVLNQHLWEEAAGLLADEWNRDWTPFSDYRGMNANMHGVEALLAAYEATGEAIYLHRAGRILDFFLRQQAPQYGHAIPEHYRQDWSVDRDYSGNPMFRPAGTTPGHSFEWARLLLQWWDLAGRPEDGSPALARAITEAALRDGWDDEKGGIFYTLEFDGAPRIRDRYWWPVTEAIGVLAALIKLERNPGDEIWYRRLWTFAAEHFIDAERGGWFPEIDAAGKPTVTQFAGKPDIYHALQASLFALSPGLSRYGKTRHENPVW
ncbi:AGE family epimerase/isomerase [Xinfangfangia sp. CPCC 101601]|uniref:AGE family epimerase/isomerase n=1 Tax=Pseudogemmobacter lacusdianii TaxID=3069608 RepID=A0ABU0W0S4_9RHOB|nr:AGE family epimerase/isomerase [Xinfangfangia sp. CPCC 101601]MDQ2066705.1 AGE family epimerase/isomerase [Xinfangfangia sp. CPCC 101601]